MKARQKGVIFIGILVAAWALAAELKAQGTEGMLYGTVKTEQATYTGLMRWGGEEALWTDMFNAAKVNNDYAALVPKDKSGTDSWSGFNWSFSSIWENKDNHQFSCQFGNIRELVPQRNGQVMVRFKNGGEMLVSGEGYNDIGAKVQLIDSELGVVSIAWEKIRLVTFQAAPAKVEEIFGVPLYGTVEGVRKEKYTGYIVWDNDERLSLDKLDGDDADGRDVSVKFADVVSITRSGKGSMVKLRSGRELFLDNSNDVNSGNRGVLVVSPEIGVVKFPWSTFKQVTFSEPTVKSQAYAEFPSPSILNGTVTQLDGPDAAGRIIFDIDEALDFELLEGKENDVEYMIPFRNIKRISPRNFDYSTIELTSGRTLLLGGQRDVSEDNSGLLVFVNGRKEPVYIRWKNVSEIIFQ